ncbi:MAG TPA: hypothetical protein VJ808_07330 [Gemmatimonadales bacterium]|nr:hypothetical protein [Gemmatimonadales bacterium]
MRRALHIAALIVGLNLGVVPVAPAQSATAGWQTTPASVLKSTLRNVVAAQDKYRAKHPSFASSVQTLRVELGPDVKVQILAVSERGWRAKATHRARPGRSCVVFVGRLAGVEAPRTDGDGQMAGEERVPLCDRME